MGQNISSSVGSGGATGYTVQLTRYGVVVTDSGASNEQPQVPLGNVSSGTIAAAACRLTQVATNATTFKVYSVNSGTNVATELGSFTIPLGSRTVSMSSLLGTAVSANVLLSLMVTSGSDGRDLVVTLTVGTS